MHFAMWPTPCTTEQAHLLVFYKLQNPHVTPTFKTEMLHLVSNIQLVNGFTVKRKVNTALPCSFSMVTHDVLRY